MKKRSISISPATLTVLVLTVSLLLFTSIALLFVNNESSSGKGNGDPDKTVSFPQISSIPFDPSTYTIEWQTAFVNDQYVEAEEELISSSASYPVISGGNNEATEKINSYIYDFITEKVKITEYDIISVKDDVKWSESQDFPFYPYLFTTSYRVVYQKNGFLSVLFENIKEVGLNDPTEKLYSFCFNLSTGELADFSDFIGADKSFSVNYVSSLFSQLIDINSDYYYLDAKSFLVDVISLYNFYFNDQGVVIYIEADVIAPSVYGIPNFTIPYSELGL